MNKEVRKESSIPVATRISIVDLAKMVSYWDLREDVHIKTMSQLVSWTFTAMVDVIEANSKGVNNINSVLDAHRYLQDKGLYQQSLKKRGQSRITAALGFENLRNQGNDPREHSSIAYNTIHSKHSAEPFNEQVNVGESRKAVSDEEMAKMVDMCNNLPNKQEQGQSPEEVLQLAKASGVIVSESEDKLERTVSVKEVNEMSDEEYIRSREKLDEERVKAEREVDLSEIKTVKE